MFACIFFKEDVSLSVVNKNDKNLELLGLFEPKGRVRMTWGKKIYNGVIIKVSENEEELYKFAAKANKDVLEGQVSKLKSHATEEMVDHLLKVEVRKQSGKRHRVQTEKIKESLQQEVELSPRKKKKMSSSQSAVMKEKTRHNSETLSTKQCQESSSMETSKLVMSLMDQFNDQGLESATGTTQTEETTNTTQASTPSKMFTATTLSTVFTDTTLSAMPTVTDTTPNTTAEVQTSTVRRCVSMSPIERAMLTLTSLTESWGICKDAMSTVNSSPLRPGTSCDIVRTLKAISDPDFIRFVNNLQSHLQHDLSCSHPCLQIPGVSSSLEYSGNTGFMNMMDLTDTSTFSGNLHTSTPYMTVNEQKSYMQSSYLPLTARSGPMQQQSLSTEMQLQGVYTEVETSENCEMPSVSQQHFTTLEPEKVKTTPRRSPRKHKQKTEADMVKLLKTGNLMIDRDQLRKATAKARCRSGKEGFFLTYRLTDTIFTIEELANCRGLGIGKVKLSIKDRAPLDPSRVKDLKDYVTSWCKTNSFHIPTDAEMNAAITEKIGYARKKFKKLL